ncbi:MAG: AMP-binding protein [Acidobacteriia bacterium]|nr:AMP-binding protein [Terriglobia bacterium]
MPNFLEHIFARLESAANRPVLAELRSPSPVSVTGGELLDEVRRARAWLRKSGLRPGDRCALVGANSILWVALDLALMAEGVVVVPLYSRQAPAELAAMVLDAQPRFLFCADAALGKSIAAAWPAGAMAPTARVTFQEVFLGQIMLGQAPAQGDIPNRPIPLADSALVTIIYTSGTSGEAKGVCLNLANVSFMLGCTTGRLDQLMHQPPATASDRVFHYLPFNFAASWLLLLSCLSRESTLTLSTDLNKLADEIRAAEPHYFLNVPTLLERVRRGVEDALGKRGALVRALFSRAREAWQRRADNQPRFLDSFFLALAGKLIFSKIRQRFGPHLRALICGSAPLAPETQYFFLMLGIPVLQAYGLTETTGICTLDDPTRPPLPGFVGVSIPGIQMKIGENQELLVRGPHIFPGYWRRPEETAQVLRSDWFHTGDQAEFGPDGHLRIIGRVKNLLVLNSGHKIAPEPIEEKLQLLIPGAQQVVVVGNGRGYLCALITGPVGDSSVQAALDALNPELPHYRQLHHFTVLAEPFTPEAGLLTANGKLRREAINSRFANQINAMYDRRQI